MKILFIGDPHIKTDNHEEVNMLITHLKIICTEQQIEKIIIGGDLMHYHERIFTQALNKALEFVTILATYAPVDILVGNHDMINNQQFLTSQHWLTTLQPYKNVKVIDRPLVQTIGSFSYLSCPYVYPGRFIEAIETIEKNWMNVNLIFAHQEFKGCKMGAIVSVDGDNWKENYPQVISGHIHDNQHVQKNIYYPGAPLQHAFGDTDKRVVCIIDTDTSPFSISDIQLNVPKKIIIKTTISDLQKKTQSIGLSNTLKLKVSATAEEFKLFKQTAEYKKCIDKGVKIQLEHITPPCIKNEKIDSELSLETKTFRSILYELIKSDGDSLLQKIYSEMINDGKK